MSPTHLIPADLLKFARSMRQDPAPAELKLWHCLRDRRLNKFKFRRQHPMPPFIADFYCAQLELMIELDGESHEECVAYDANRTRRLERDGCHVIRFSNADVYWNLEAVLGEILTECERLDDRNHPHPSPLPAYGERE